MEVPSESQLGAGRERVNPRVVGVSMGVVPFVLGALSAAVGVTAAFMLVPALLLVGALRQADGGGAGAR